jgi:hypothetical protein
MSCLFADQERIFFNKAGSPAETTKSLQYGAADRCRREEWKKEQA